LVRRMTITAAHTMTKAMSVPMFTSSARSRSGKSAATIATRMPVSMVALWGVRKRGCTAAKNSRGISPSRANGEQHARLAQQQHEEHARDADHGAEGDDEVGHPEAARGEGGRDRCVDVDFGIRHHPGQHGRHQYIEHGAEAERGDDTMGTSRCGLRASSACVETESKPM